MCLFRSYQRRSTTLVNLGSAEAPSRGGGGVEVSWEGEGERDSGGGRQEV